eukprot:CAMPEP_0170454374 /NCGR_PEP_ID=MMETSP0123-20130129/2649_1 /TAXON_ID=182087 /ORGANISM="Favella ehrenbergii, Strain Fehren 1" /LENGTH=63 /DNA_ID=CAMNT_0010717069 /DNA_START=1149 /DNA_END=1340 /DNA_ORIENTATION=+
MIVAEFNNREIIAHNEDDTVNVDSIVAEGAAHMARILAGKAPVDARVDMLDVTPLSLGTDVIT